MQVLPCLLLGLAVQFATYGDVSSTVYRRRTTRRTTPSKPSSPSSPTTTTTKATVAPSIAKAAAAATTAPPTSETTTLPTTHRSTRRRTTVRGKVPAARPALALRPFNPFASLFPALIRPAAAGAPTYGSGPAKQADAAAPPAPAEGGAGMSMTQLHSMLTLLARLQGGAAAPAAAAGVTKSPASALAALIAGGASS